MARYQVFLFFCLSMLIATQVSAEEAVTDVSIQDAMQWTVEHHPRGQLSKESVNEARALLNEVESGYQPHVGLTASQARLTTNLRAQGFPATVKFLPARLGPFNSFDARLTFTQTVFDLTLIRETEASEARVNAREHGERAVHDELMTLGALAYVSTKAAEARVEAEAAALDLAEKLLTLAQDQRKEGIATGVDVTRSEHRVSQERYQLRLAEAHAEEARVRLKRLMGLPMDRAIRLTTALDAVRTKPVASKNQRVAEALSQREELKMLESEIKGAQASLRAADAMNTPRVGLQANIGPSGITPSDSVYGTGMIGIGISIPILSGGEIQAQKSRALSELNSIQLQAEDLRHQVEEDVRVSAEELSAAESLKESADTGLLLAHRLYSQAEDRFKSGVADTLEVVDASSALASARSAKIEAEAGFLFANINHAAALGRINEWTAE